MTDITATTLVSVAKAAELCGWGPSNKATRCNWHRIGLQGHRLKVEKVGRDVHTTLPDFIDWVLKVKASAAQNVFKQAGEPARVAASSNPAPTPNNDGEA